MYVRAHCTESRACAFLLGCTLLKAKAIDLSRCKIISWNWCSQLSISQLLCYILMDTGGFYRRGSSVTHSLGTCASPTGSISSYDMTPPQSGHRRFPGHPQFSPQTFTQPDITTVSQKLDRIISIVLEQAGVYGVWRKLLYYTETIMLPTCSITARTRND